MNSADYLIEKRLRELSPELHKCFSNAVTSLMGLLSRYRQMFPEYTDHSEIHTLAVINFCNRLIGTDRIRQMNADELFILLMGCYFHDVGMGTSEEDFREFSSKIDFGDYFETHDTDDIAHTIRAFHHELSGCFLDKYAHIFELPSEEHEFAIIQTARGHRKKDLFDEEEYPESILMGSGNSVSVPYLAAILRLADEIDVAVDRTPAMFYDLSTIDNPKQIYEFHKHEAVRQVELSESAITLYVKTDDDKVYDGIVEMAGKIQATLDYCAEVVSQRTPWTITQKQVLINRE